MSSRRDAAAILAMCAYVKKRIAKIEEAARDTADVTYPEEKTAGTVGGRVVSYTTRLSSRPRELFTILDDTGFIEWVAQRFPTEIVNTVRPSFLTVLAEKAHATSGVLIDDQGEVCEAVKVNDPTVYTRTTLTKDAAATLEPLLAGLTLESLPDYIETEPDKEEN